MLTTAQQAAISEASELFSNHGRLLPPPEEVMMRVPAQVLYHLFTASLALQQAHVAQPDAPPEVAPRVEPTETVSPGPKAKCVPPVSAVVVRVAPESAEEVEEDDEDEDDEEFTRLDEEERFPILDVSPLLSLQFASAYVAFERGDVSWATVERTKRQLLDSTHRLVGA